MAGKFTDRKKPSTAKLVIKTIIAVIIGLFFIMTAFSAIAAISEDFVDYGDDTAAMINSCNRSYYEKDYSELRDTLILFELYDDDFDKYWEICSAYEQYVFCRQYSFVEGGADQMDYHRDRLLEMTLRCRNADNTNRIRQLYEDSLLITAPED